jgi:Succinyl-CoA synthetase, beta subunit
MDLMEYKARELYVKYGIPAMQGVVADNPDELESKVSGLNYPVVVKAQVQTGGRGKAGGIRFADSLPEAIDISNKIFGMDIKGHIVRKLLIVEKAEVQKEWYLSIVLDRLTKGPVVIFSTEGGVDIEETAKNNSSKVLKVGIDPLVGINDYIPRYLLSKSGCGMTYFDQLYGLLKNLYRLFIECDCMLVEINPLGLICPSEDGFSDDYRETATNGGTLIALDGKISVDDSALTRQPDILAFRDSLIEDELVLEARKFNFLYIPCDPKGSIAVMSNGSGMIMSCIDMITKNGMKVGTALDLGGGATADRISQAIRIILTNPDIKGLFINIFGGITRCDEVASGIKEAMEVLKKERLVIVRFEGTNKEKGIEILNTIKGNVVAVNGLRDGVNEMVARRAQL